MILFLISFIAGVLTVLAPCVLPLLPVIVGGSLASGSRRRAYAICLSLGGSVIIFTLLLKASTAFVNIPQSFWSGLSGGILILFGIVMLFPWLWDSLRFVNKLNLGSNKLLATGYKQNSLWGDILMGAALGPVFSSCSPTYFVILATVLPASFAVGFADLLAYAIGLSGSLFIISIAGQKLVDKLGLVIEPEGWFRKTIGVLFIVVGLLVLTGIEKKLETWLLNNGFDATRIEQRLLGAPNGSSIATSTDSVANMSPEQKALIYSKAPELTSIDGYINTNGEPITIAQYNGKKVVLIDIWTYSCINCQRTLPYIKMWYDQYADAGLEIIGVHTPEFAFEHVLANVQQAVNGFGINYPVVLDNEYGTWNAFGNQFWPRKYLIDIDGFIVYDHAGEGNYAETEKAIQKALAERASRMNEALEIPQSAEVPSSVVSVDSTRLASPEIYFGAARNEYLGNGAPRQAGTQTFTLPQRPEPNTLYLGGTWNITEEYAQNQTAKARIHFFYHAKNVYFVAASEKAVKIKITRDGGKPLGGARGTDVDVNGAATIQADRLYHIVGDTEYAPYILEIEIEGAGLQAYTFTFG